MIQRLIVGLLALHIAFAPVAAHASLGGQINDWFDGSSYANVTGSGAYESQMGGYYNGGGFRVRVPSQDVGTFAYATPFKYSSGCSGIDLELGGFGLVSKDQIVNQLRAIGQNAKGLVFSMAISYVSTLLGSKIDQFKGIADFLNGMQSDSCNAAASLLSKGAEQFGASANEGEYCIRLKMAKEGLDYNEARRACTSSGLTGSTMNAADVQNKYMFTNGNLAWYFMMQSPFFRTDKEFAEVVMNMTGTYIVTPDPADAQKESNVVPARPMIVADCRDEGCLTPELRTLIDVMVYGVKPDEQRPKIKIFRCNPSDFGTSETSCKTLKTSGGQLVYEDFDTSAMPNVKDKLKNRIQSIYNKIIDNQALSEDEKDLIETSAAPLYRYLVTSAAYFKRPTVTTDATLNKYMDAMAKDMIMRNLQNVVGNIRLSAMGDKGNDKYDSNKKEYIANVEKLMAVFGSISKDAQDEMQYVAALQFQGQQYEKAIIGRLSPNLLANALYAR